MEFNSQSGQINDLVKMVLTCFLPGARYLGYRLFVVVVLQHSKQLMLIDCFKCCETTTDPA